MQVGGLAVAEFAHQACDLVEGELATVLEQDLAELDDDRLLAGVGSDDFGIGGGRGVRRGGACVPEQLHDFRHLFGRELAEHRLDPGEDVHVLAGDAVALELRDQGGQQLAGPLGRLADMLLLGLLPLERGVLRHAGAEAEDQGD